jgi:hypothetical protein
MWNSQYPQTEVYPRLLARASKAVREGQFCLDTELFLPMRVDEVSILFKHNTELDGFVRYCVSRDLEHFNGVRDTCHNEWASDPNTFQVRFEFLRYPGADWRIEAMCVNSGFAPLHERLRNHSMPHVSFKCLDTMHYDHINKVLTGILPWQGSYRNSYGAFSYFGAYAPYIKPRVNLRDAKPAVV